MIRFSVPEVHRRERNAAVRWTGASLRNTTALSIRRFARLGGARRVLMAPVTHAGRVLAALELIDPLHGVTSTTQDSRALALVAERYGRFLVDKRLLGDVGARAPGPV
jgi:hypothetical protein